MVYVQNTFMGFQIPITVGIKLYSISVILTFHMMNCTSKFTWMDLNTFPSMVYVQNTFMGFQIHITGIIQLISINGNLTTYMQKAKFTLMEIDYPFAPSENSH